jgi:hypothetical protein
VILEHSDQNANLKYSWAGAMAQVVEWLLKIPSKNTIPCETVLEK